MITDINSEDRLVQKTFADYLRHKLGWECAYAWNEETFGPKGTLGRSGEREAVLVRDLRTALARLNPDLPEKARQDALDKLIRADHSRSLLQHNRELYRFIRDGVPVSWHDANGRKQYGKARVIDYTDAANNRYLAVRELKIQGLLVPHYNRRADLICFVNGMPLVFIELKAVYKNIRLGFDNNLTDYMTQSIAHAFHHNTFLVVSNGDRARYGSITGKWEHFHEWKRNTEKEKGSVEAQVLIDGMLAKDRLLDLIRNFILFDDSKPGGTRKIIARNHQVLGVNNTVAAVQRQEELKHQFPPGARIIPYHAKARKEFRDGDPSLPMVAESPATAELPLIERAHPDLGRIGVFWHTQGSGKSYSMIFFSEKVRRIVPGNFTFVVMTDREDLDNQIFRTFVGCGAADEKTPRAGSGKKLKKLLGENHRFVFTLIQKFRREKPPKHPYSERDDIIVISDEAHRTQAGKLARNMRLALPNAAFVGFTGTPLFKDDHLTQRIFGSYISRYDFKRSEEDKSTVKLIYENRGEKLGITRLDLNDRIAEKIEEADLDPDQIAQLEKLLGKDYEVITADDRLVKLACDFVDQTVKRWVSGKAMLVCIDKITCGRMFYLIQPLWRARLDSLKAKLSQKESTLPAVTKELEKRRLEKAIKKLRKQIDWMESTIIEFIISEAQNEVKHFEKWCIDIKPHRLRMKKGFEIEGGKALPVDDAFKDPDHPFRIAIVCAMWLTGFDVECLSTLYIDKPMKAHTLMQAIARANRVYPGKDCGVIVDYNGMLKSLREALAQYALGDDDDGTGGRPEVVIPLEERVAALIQAIEAAEQHLRGLGFEPARLVGAEGFERIAALRDAVEALYASDEAKRRFEIMAREVFARFRTLITEPAVYQYAERHDNLETIYKKLSERRDLADVTEVLKALHRIVNEAIRTQGPGDDHADGLKVDLSEIDFEKLREEFAGKVKRRNTVIQDIREVVEKKLQQMLATNPTRMDYYKKYQEIIAEYNREKDRATVEETFRKLMDLAGNLDEEQQRTVKEGLSEDELALFDLLYKENISKAARERLKQASRSLLASLIEHLTPMQHWFQNAQTQADVEVFILDRLTESLPDPPFTAPETQELAHQVYEYVWQRYSSDFPLAA